MRARLLLAALAWAAIVAAQNPEPTREEIASAYRSKYSEGGLPGVRWERRRITNIRGWSLKFNRTLEKRSIGVLTFHYQVIAKKSGQCAEYLITDVIPIQPSIPQMKPSLTVDPKAVKACR